MRPDGSMTKPEPRELTLRGRTFLVLVIEEIVEELLERRALGTGPGGAALGIALQCLGGRDIDYRILKTFGDIGDRLGPTREARRGTERYSGKECKARRRETPTPKAEAWREGPECQPPSIEVSLTSLVAI
jgi:hypothetical protein